MHSVEIDVLVAEKVMGCKVLDPDKDDVEFQTCGCETERHSEVTGWTTSIKRYSTDIEAAWEVIGKLRERKLRFALEQFSDGFYCRFIRFGTIQTPGTSEQIETAPMAICVAALKTVGIEVTLDKLELGKP